MLTDVEFFHRKDEARAELQGHGVEPWELLRPSWRRLVADQLRPWAQPRRQETQARWDRLLDLAAVAKPTSLGFIEVPDGGLRTFTAEFGWQPSAAGRLSHTLKDWQERGLLLLYYGIRDKNHPPVRGIQIPWATATLLTLADVAASGWHSPDGNPPWPLGKLVAQCGERREAVPVVVSVAECKRELRRLGGTSSP